MFFENAYTNAVAYMFLALIVMFIAESLIKSKHTDTQQKFVGWVGIASGFAFMFFSFEPMMSGVSYADADFGNTLLAWTLLLAIEYFGMRTVKVLVSSIYGPEAQFAS